MVENANRSDILDLNDDQLSYFVKDGNDFAFDELISRYVSVIKSKISGFRNLGIDDEDLFQEGLIGLLNAAKTFDSSGKASFSTYAGLCIKRRMYSLYKSVKRQKRVPVDSLVSFTENDENIKSSDLNNPELVFIKKEEKALRNYYIEKTLSNLELKVLSMYLMGHSYTEISEKINVNHKTVDNALQRIKKKLRGLE